MKKQNGLKLWGLLAICLVIPQIISAQSTITVRGTVVDDAGETMIGVSVQIKETKSGTITDFDGKYSIKAPANATLVFSYVGYKTKEIPVAGKSHRDVTLESDAQTLDEVVVVA